MTIPEATHDARTLPEAPQSARTLLEAIGVSKSFGGTQALSDVSLRVRSGAVHALVGGNGSGKSTLTKVLAGVYAGDTGTLRVGDRKLSSADVTPAWSRAAGLRFVHQDLGLFDDLTVAENLMSDGGYPATRWGRVKWRALRADAQAALERLQLDIKPDALVSTLRPASRALLGIARALRQEGQTSVLFLDEPTAPLPAAEVSMLLEKIRGLAAHDVGIVFISHRLEEVTAIADDITVLRDGVVAASRSAEGLDEDGLLSLLVGRELDRVVHQVEVDDTKPVVLDVSGLHVGGITGLDLQVREGEVVGVGGLIGSGRSTLLRTLFGAGERHSGTVTLNGEGFAPKAPPDAINRGVAYLPENRAKDAAFHDFDVSENLSIANLRRYHRRRGLDRKQERRDAGTDIRDLSIRARSPGALLATLSGGNQQKTVLARWFRRPVNLLLLDEPTSGVDISSRADIHALIRTTANKGAAVLVVSSDFEELAVLCDRVVVLTRGRITAEGRPPAIDRHWIAERAHGQGALNT